MLRVFNGASHYKDAVITNYNKSYRKLDLLAKPTIPGNGRPTG